MFALPISVITLKQINAPQDVQMAKFGMEMLVFAHLILSISTINADSVLQTLILMAHKILVSVRKLGKLTIELAIDVQLLDAQLDKYYIKEHVFVMDGHQAEHVENVHQMLSQISKPILVVVLKAQDLMQTTINVLLDVLQLRYGETTDVNVLMAMQDGMELVVNAQNLQPQHLMIQLVNAFPRIQFILAKQISVLIVVQIRSLTMLEQHAFVKVVSESKVTHVFQISNVNLIKTLSMDNVNANSGTNSLAQFALKFVELINFMINLFNVFVKKELRELEVFVESVLLDLHLIAPKIHAFVTILIKYLSLTIIDAKLVLKTHSLIVMTPLVLAIQDIQNQVRHVSQTAHQMQHQTVKANVSVQVVKSSTQVNALLHHLAQLGQLST